MAKDYNTKRLIFGVNCYCAYCGKKIKPEVEYEEYERHVWYNCDCADAIKQAEIEKEIRITEGKIRELIKQIPEVNEKMLAKLEYKHKIREIKNKG